jgi:hypothetical protein
MNKGRGKRLAFVRPDGAVCVIDNRTPMHPETAGEILAPLSGLREIYVEIAQIEPEIEQNGLKAKEIERYLDRKFKEAVVLIAWSVFGFKPKVLWTNSSTPIYR